MNLVALALTIALAVACYVLGRIEGRDNVARGFVLDLSTKAAHTAVVRLDGKDIARFVSGVTVDARAGAIATVTLTMNPSGLAVRLDGAVVDAIDHPMWAEKSGAPERSGPERGRGAAVEP